MKKKCLTIDNLAYFVNKILLASAPKENHYHVELQQDIDYSFTVPSYAKGKSIVDVYMNGFRLIPTIEYTLSDAGVIHLLMDVHSDGNKFHVVHRKWG